MAALMFDAYRLEDFEPMLKATEPFPYCAALV